MSIEVILRFRRSGGAEYAAEYQVDVVRAPGSGWGGPLRAGGLDGAHIASIQQAYRRYVARRQQADGIAGGVGEGDGPLRAAGAQLFEALPPPVQQRLDRAQAVAREKAAPLRLRLGFDRLAEPLLRLPWELLYNPRRRAFLALEGEGVTRRLLMEAPVALPAGYRPQNVLGIWSEPRDLPPLTVRRGFAPSPDSDEPWRWLKHPGSAALLQALEKGGVDALHLVAHGRGGEAWADFALALEDEAGNAQWIGGERLAAMLGSAPGLRLIYLDVCAGESGTGQAQSDFSAAGGVALQLLRRGVPAVVLMQHNMTQAASGEMARAFYRGVAAGDSPAAAMARGRRAIRLQQGDPVHWSVPVLYAQEADPNGTEVRRSPADWVLDRFAEVHARAALLLLSLLLVIAHASAGLARAGVGETRLVAAMLVEAVLLPALAAALTRRGQARLRREHDLRGTEWFPVLQHKYLAAAVWSGMAWAVVGVLCLAAELAGLWVRIGTGVEQGVWALFLTLVAAAGGVGARQGIRQSALFEHGKREPRWRGWLLPVTILFMPALLFATGAWFGVYVVGEMVLLALALLFLSVLGFLLRDRG